MYTKVLACRCSVVTISWHDIGCKCSIFFLSFLVDVERVHSGNNGDGGSGGLSRTILIAVICVSCACGLILVLATFALIATCYCHNKTPQHQKLKMSV